MTRRTYSSKEIEEQYESGSFRITQERSDFLLPQITDYVKNKKWINTKPEYQRRLVWDIKKRSRFIESLLMNVPIPPIFLFESELNRYEVMDGQQRLNTIIDFYDNRFSLSGLEQWKVLNGYKYGDCPTKIQRGLDRRRISAVVLLAESVSISDTKEDIRKLVFERLNTGGETLRPQELRNCLYDGNFNRLLIELAGNRLFNEIWGIPPYEDNIHGDHIVSKELSNNNLYKRMGDCEIVLRFFAFRNKAKIKGAVKQILDNCMKENQNIIDTTKEEWQSQYLETLHLAHEIFDEDTFRILDENRRSRLSQPLYDAVMIALHRMHEHRKFILLRKTDIKMALKTELDDENFYKLIVARANTADAVKKRLNTVQELINNFV